ncbi:MAG TPA: phage tail protein [Pyrinomonadaceae bacterium]
MIRKQIITLALGIALFIAWALDYVMGLPRDGEMRADPVSIGVMLAITAITYTAQYGLQRLLAGKQKPLERGRLNGGLQLQDSDFGLFINEIYGGDPGDGLGGGVKVAGIIQDASEMRRIVTTSQESTGRGKGGGGGGGSTQTVKTTKYYMDLDIKFGRGPLVFKKIWFVTSEGMKLVYDVTTDFTQTGVIDPDFPAEDPQDHFLLPDPKLGDDNPKYRFSHIPAPDPQGTIEGTIVAGGYSAIRIYSGTGTQLPDPLFAGINDAKYGAPAGQIAYRGHAHIVFENVDVSGGVPIVLALVEHAELKTLDAILEDRARRAGADPSDLNFADLSDIPVRGYVITQEQAPRSDMEELARVFDANFFEDIDGTITGEHQDYSTVVVIDDDEIGARAKGGDESSASAPPDKVTIEQAQATTLPTQLHYRFLDTGKNYDPNKATGLRQVTTSEKNETVEFQVVMTFEEAQKAVDRDIQKLWAECDIFSFNLFPKYAYLRPGQRIIVPKDGELCTVKLEEASGALPGPRKMTARSQKSLPVTLPVSGGGSQTPKPANLPANTVATFMDIPRLLTQQNVPGFLVAATPKDLQGGAYEWTGATLWVDKGDGPKQIMEFDAPATMGRAVGVLPDVPGGWSEGDWDDTSTGAVDLFGDKELQTTSDDEVLDGANVLVWGNEVIAFVNAVKVGGYPNRWTVSRLQRKLKSTGAASSTHVDEERVCLLDAAVKFVKVDVSEKDKERTYWAPTNGQARADAAPITFTWTGRTIGDSASVAGVDEHVPTVTLAAMVSKIEAREDWLIITPAPDAYGATLTHGEIHIEKSDDADAFEVWPMDAGPTHVIPQKPYECEIKYRWHNGSAEDAGNGVGWSDWSPNATAAKIGDPIQTPGEALDGFDFDPNDSLVNRKLVQLQDPIQ